MVRKLVALTVLLLLGFLITACETTPSEPEINHPTYEIAHPLGDGAQMFDEERQFKKLIPQGTVCDFLGGAYIWEEAGIKISMYKLNCNGTIGYINQKWVTRK